MTRIIVCNKKKTKHAEIYEGIEQKLVEPVKKIDEYLNELSGHMMSLLSGDLQGKDFQMILFFSFFLICVCLSVNKSVQHAYVMSSAQKSEEGILSPGTGVLYSSWKPNQGPLQ